MGAGQSEYFFCKIQYAVFSWVPDIDRPCNARRAIHQAQYYFDEVVYIAERAGLQSVAKYRKRQPLKSLDDQIRYYAAVVWVHAGTISVENAADFNLHLVHSMIVEEKGLCAPLPFVVAGANADCVYIAPIPFRLRMYVGIAVHFACRGLENLTPEPLGKAKQIDRPKHACLRGLDRVGLIMERRSRASEIEDLINLDVERMANVVAQALKMGMVDQMAHILAVAGIKIIDA